MAHHHSSGVFTPSNRCRSCLLARVADQGKVLMRWFSGLGFVASVFGAAHVLAAADSTAVIGRGATRDQVISAFGVPSGKSKVGNIEVLHYPSRQVRLENGRVERITSRIGTPPPTPAASAPAN